MRAIISHPPAKPSAIESLALAKFKAVATDRQVEDVAKTMGARDDVLVLHQRATTTVGTTTSNSHLLRTAFGDYLGSLQGSAAARIIGLGMTVPMGSFEGFSAPARNTAPAALPWVGEGAPIPVRSFDFLGLRLVPKKMGAISVISREVGRRAGGEAAVRQVLQEDAALSVDLAYFSATASSASDHPGLLAGLTAIPGYGGGDKVAFENDVSNILAVIGPRNSGSIAFVTGMYAAERIALKFPDFKSPVFGSPAVSDTTLIGVDAGNLVHAFGDFEIDVSMNATLHMSDAPAELVTDAGAVADPTRSLLQTDSMAVRILGDVAFAARKANSVAFVAGTTW